MEGLKTVLWVCAVGFLLNFIFAALPWQAMTAWANVFGFQMPAAEPFHVFTFRLCLATYGMIGVFFVILARNPLKYGGMLLLAAYGLLCLGVLSLVGGIRYSLPPIIYVGDIIFCFITGALILLFRKEAIRVNST
jgi:hypothetical protein